MEKVMPSSSISLIKLNKAYMMEDGTSKRRDKQKRKDYRHEFSQEIEI